MSQTRDHQDQDQDQPDPATSQAVIPAPGFSSLPPPLPGQANPDPAPAGGESGSSEQSPPTRIEIPKAKGKAYAKIAQGFLHAVGGLINRAVAVDDEDLSFLPDGDDDATIPPPLGRLAARRVPLGDGNDLSDFEDIGQAVVGLIAWGIKGLTDHLNARRERGPRRKKVPAQAEHQDDNPDAQA